MRVAARLALLLLVAACAPDDVPPPTPTTSPGAPEIGVDPPAPPLVSEGNPLEGTRLETAAGHWRVTFRTEPSPIPLNDPFDVEVEVTPLANPGPGSREAQGAKGASDAKVELRVDAGMPQHGHGMNHAPLHERGADGRWTARGLLFHMPGAWTLTFDVTQDGLTERAATVVVLE